MGLNETILVMYFDEFLTAVEIANALDQDLSFVENVINGTF